MFRRSRDDLNPTKCRVPSPVHQQSLMDMAASRPKFAVGYWSKGCTNVPGPIF